MFDGIKIQDVSVCVDTLLTNDRLTFGSLVDGQTGAILNPTRRSFDRGLTFRLIPRRTGHGYRVEVKGSLHKYHNNGQHNADQFTVNDLLLTLDQLVRQYGFDLFSSKINNVEFGVNLELPFPVSHVLKNLICYKNQPFALDHRSDTPYYVCNLQRYAVKLYDKGKQRGLTCNLLRVEVRVKKMEYFNGTGVRLITLVDLLNVANYGPLGALLVGTFNEILFDDPTIDPNALTPRQKTIYQDGRNPRFWQMPDNLTFRQANTHRQKLSRAKWRYRALLDQNGGNWQQEVAALISHTWNQLTALDNDLLSNIFSHRAVWQNMTKPDFLPNLPELIVNPANTQQVNENCHELTESMFLAEETAIGATCHELTVPSTPLSHNNPLYSGVICDSDKPHQPTTAPGEAVCPVTGVPIHHITGRGVRRFVSAAMLRNNDDLLMRLNSQFRQYAKGSKEDEYSRAAHKARNAHSNPRNNLRRRINRINQHPTLFDLSTMVRLTADQRAALDHWQGTSYEVPNHERPI